MIFGEMSMKFIIIYICVFCSLIFSKEFILSEKESSKSIVVFNSDKIEKNFRSIEKIENIDNLKSSFYYHIKDGYDIEVELKYDSVTSVNINDIIINNESSLLSNTLEVFSSEKVTLSDIKIFRGIPIREVTVSPFEYSSSEGLVHIYNNVTLEINEFSSVSQIQYQNVKLSKAFEPLFEDLIINYERSSRSEDYQTPSILYICGGSSISHPFVQELLDWRHKTGYIVNAVSTNEIGSNTNQVKSYIQNAYDNWENPPEIVALIGDTGGSYEIGYYTEGWSGYNGAGDFPYCQLDGSDLLPEVFIGRISVNSSSDISNVINKTIAYEKASYINQTGTDWYERAALCGDPSSSGNSTMITNEYVENILDVYGFEEINTNLGNGNYDNWMENQLENGNLYMNYRGYYGASGFGSSEINGANNGYQNPFVSFITCGTGDFNYTSLSEEFFRAGTVSNPKGAVAAVGTATTGTHTLFNNIMSMGIFDGIFPKKLGTAGAAVANGRLSLLYTYPSDPSNKVSIFSHWLNLIGDPGLMLWTDTPSTINASFNQSLSWGTNFIDVEVTDESGAPVSGALVTLLKGDDEIFKSSYSNEYGIAAFDLDYNLPGVVFVTITKQDCIPIEGFFDIIQPNNNVNLSIENISVVDVSDGVANGNGDGMLNPGEIAYLSLPLYNYGNSVENNIQAVLTSSSDNVNIIYGVSQYQSIESNQIGFQNNNFVIELNPEALNNADLNFRLSISNGSDVWESNVPFDLYGGMIELAQTQSINNFEINPGEQVSLSISLKNVGSIPVDNVELSLLPSGYLIDIEQEYTSFGTISPGSVVESSIPVDFYINGNTINGSALTLNAIVTNSLGYSQDLSIPLQVGQVSVTDPLGPDEYGYYIYDSGDLGYNLAPIYDWMEIDQDFGGDGINLDLYDSGDGNNISNSSAIVDLPFPFTFYGIEYNSITVNTNGWIAFGESSLESFRNYPVPGAGGPSPMLACFWDDLKTTGNAEIYKYIGENFVVIQWSEMRTYNNNSVETFQVILYDNTNLTPTGDNEILIQYKEFNNTSSGNLSGWGNTHGGYSTIGIENHLSTVGLQYTFNNVYPTAAMPLDDNKAIFITTRNPVETLLGDANQDNEINVLDVVVIVNHIINLELMDPMSIFISDIDGNGQVNILDVIQIINVILEL